MNTRENIIDNILEYSAPELVEILIQRVLTIGDLVSENPGEFDIRKRKETEELLWNRASTSGDCDLLSLYITNYPEGKYRDQAENRLQEIPTSVGINPMEYEREETFEPEQKIVNEWDLVDSDSIDSLQEYIRNNPEGEHVREARIKISELRRKERGPRGKDLLKFELGTIDSKYDSTYTNKIQGLLNSHQITSRDILEVLKEDFNALPVATIKNLISTGSLSTYELEEIGIAKDFIDVVDDSSIRVRKSEIDFTHMQNPTGINQVCQEVYFWGMPSSGKTCALGGILSAAQSGMIAKTLEKNEKCMGLDYMRQLSSLFVPGAISYLPTGTRAEFVSDMSFWLLDQKDRVHSITMIDIAGELLHAMSMVEQNRLDELSEYQEAGYRCLRNLLVDRTSKNSKIHFFVLEYGGHERTEKGIAQSDLLDTALRHIKSLGILTHTDGIYILLTKADKALSKGGDTGAVLKDYVKTHYSSFYNQLVMNAKGVNGGRKHIEMYPFTIGEVCFKDLCRFDPETSNSIVELLLERTVGESIGKRGVFNKIMRK